MPNQTFVPLKEAAQKHNVDEQVLTQLISAGMIVAKEEAGEILVVMDKNSSREKTKEEIITAKFGDLVGQPITLSEAAKKYDIPRGTLNSWFRQSNYISPIDPSDYPARFDEAEIAYLVGIYRKRRTQRSRAPLLDNNGLPYRIIHPKLAEYRRRRRDNT